MCCIRSCPGSWGVVESDDSLQLAVAIDVGDLLATEPRTAGKSVPGECREYLPKSAPPGFRNPPCPHTARWSSRPKLTRAKWLAFLSNLWFLLCHGDAGPISHIDFPIKSDCGKPSYPPDLHSPQCQNLPISSLCAYLPAARLPATESRESQGPATCCARRACLPTRAFLCQAMQAMPGKPGHPTLSNSALHGSLCGTATDTRTQIPPHAHERATHPPSQASQSP